VENNLIYTFVFTLFVLWFILCIIYTIWPKFLGDLGKLLHRYGWIRQWAMYTKQLSNDGFNIVFISDVLEKNEAPIWYKVEDNFNSFSKLVYHPNFRKDFFIAKCLRKITATRRNNVGTAVNLKVFQYLCSVLTAYPNSSNSNYRKVKIMRYEKNKEPEVIIISDFIALS